MKITNDATRATAEGLSADNSENRSVLPGSNSMTDPTGRVANLSSLMTVCALAIEGAEEWREDIRERLTQDIKHVLEMGAVMAREACEAVEVAIGEAKKGGVK